VSALEQQLTKLAAAAPEPCWNAVGVYGSRTCEKLEAAVHCHNCSVYSQASLDLLDRPMLPEHRRAWSEHFARKKVEAAPARESALVFRLSAEWLALPTPAFEEVAERRLVHSLPHRRQGLVLGLVNVRGELRLCVSLARLLGLDQSHLHATQGRVYDRLLVARWHGQHFVFPTEEVCGLHRFQTQEVAALPTTLAHSRSYTTGILHWQGRTVGLLDPDLVFANLNRSLL
jgi:chemotaxis-related protein WspD